MKKQDEARERCAGYLAFCVTSWVVVLFGDQHWSPASVAFISTISGGGVWAAMAYYHNYLDHLAKHLPERAQAMGGGHELR